MVIALEKSFMGYLFMRGPKDEVLKLLTYLRDNKGRNTEDVIDAIRIINNFNVFYEMAKKKFKDYISPRKNEGDLIRGLVTVDKIKLVKSEKGDEVVIIFDKRVSDELIIDSAKAVDIEVEIRY